MSASLSQESTVTNGPTATVTRESRLRAQRIESSLPLHLINGASIVEVE